jgi:hypothetical protein
MRGLSACGKYTLATQTPQAMAKVRIAARARSAEVSRAGAWEGVRGTSAFRLGIRSNR